jgi:hypothetical protein
VKTFDQWLEANNKYIVPADFDAWLQQAYEDGQKDVIGAEMKVDRVLPKLDQLLKLADTIRRRQYDRYVLTLVLQRYPASQVQAELDVHTQTIERALVAMKEILCESV